MIAEHTGFPDHSQRGGKGLRADFAGLDFSSDDIALIQRWPRRLPWSATSSRLGRVSRRGIAYTPSPSPTAKIVASAGDPALVTYFRSSAKPIQALPIVRARPDLDDAEIAIACASHLHRPEQLEPVRSLLAKADATEDDLECGPEPTRLEHNCSGKHAAMLLLCRERGWPTEGYRLASHPCQQAMLEEISRAAEVEPDSMPTAVDGCGVVTYALTLERMAHAFSRLERLDGGSARPTRCARTRS